MPTDPSGARSRPFGALLVLLVLLALSSVARAQLPFEVISLADGLPQSQVLSMAQDRDGFLWIATLGGLARLDSATIATFTTKDGLPSNFIQELLLDREGTLWIGTAAGVARWRDRRLERFEPAGGARCRAVAEDPRGRIWLGTEEGVLRCESGTCVPVLGGPDGPAVVYDVLAAGEEAWAATSRGVFRIGGRGPERESCPPGLCEDARALALTSEGLWVGTATRGLWLRAGSRWTPVPLPSQGARAIYRISTGASGTFYVATNESGLFLRRPGAAGFERWSTQSGLPSNVVNFAFEDREENVWVGTDVGGLARFRGNLVRNLGLAEGLPSECVFSVSEVASDGTLWAGTLRGAARLRRTPEPRVVEVVGAAQGLANDLVFRAEEGPDGTLWVWSEGGLQRRRPGSARLGPVEELSPTVSADVWGFAFDAGGSLWVGSRRAEGGLAVLRPDGTSRVFDRLPDGTRIELAHAVARRSAGGAWAAFGGRIAACDGAGILPLPDPPEAMRRPYVNKLFEDGKGRLWAGSSSGLARLEADGSWTLLTEKLGSPYVYFLGEDGSGTVWAGTTRGVYRFGAEDAVSPFTPDDGLAGWETNLNAFHADRDGVVWVGTVSGLSRYDPAAHRPNAHPPRVVVEAAELPERTVAFPASLTLSWSERSLAFRVAVLSFRSRNRTAYRARLAGLEESWLPPRRSPELRYTNLPAGDLRLLVQGVNESGLRGDVVEIPIRVRPPFWMTTPFRAAALLVLVGVVAAAHRSRTLLLRRRNRELERVVAERTEALAAANRHLVKAQEEIARLLEARPAPSENLAQWSAALAAEVASAIGAERIGVFEVRGDAVMPLSDSGLPAPSIDELRAGPGGVPLAPSPDAGRAVVPVSGMSAELRGALVVQGAPVVEGDTERRLVGGFAHQLGAALDMTHMRRQLATLNEKRASTLREMHERGIATLQVCPLCGRCFDQTAAACSEDGSVLDTPRPLPFRLLDRYRFERVLGQGGMATILSARDERLARDVAIKLIRPEHFGDSEMKARFEREAKAVARISHPGVIGLFDSGELPDGTAYLVMEKLSGHDLSYLLARDGPGTPRQVARLARQAGAALSAAHRAGVVHRDVKPANLFLVDEPAGFRVKVLDFGLAKSMAYEKGLTQTGMIVGTPEYMSPEQVRGWNLDARTDVYSLGAVCYEALSGRRAIGGEDVGRVMVNVLVETPEPISTLLPGVPQEAAAALEAALAKEPLDRPSDVAAWAEELATGLERMPEGLPGWAFGGLPG